MWARRGGGSLLQEGEGVGSRGERRCRFLPGFGKLGARECKEGGGEGDGRERDDATTYRPLAAAPRLRRRPLLVLVAELCPPRPLAPLGRPCPLELGLPALARVLELGPLAREQPRDHPGRVPVGRAVGCFLERLRVRGEGERELPDLVVPEPGESRGEERERLALRRRRRSRRGRQKSGLSSGGREGGRSGRTVPVGLWTRPTWPCSSVQ